MKKQFTAIFLALALCLGLVTTAFAGIGWDSICEGTEYPAVGGNLYFDEEYGAIQGADKDVTVANIPASINGVAVKTINVGAFSECAGLTAINVDADNLKYASIDGVLFSKDKTDLVMVPVKKSGLYVIPNGVTTIGAGAFGDCRGLTGVTIPGSVTSIEAQAFWGCAGLTGVTIPGSVTSIEAQAFEGCVGLTDISIPDSVTNIGHYVFQECKNLTHVRLPSNVTSLYGTFDGCTSLTSITIPASVTNIEDGAFRYCTGLTDIIIPGGVTTIGEVAFYSCTSLTSITIPSSVEEIKRSAFGDCTSLKDVYYGGTEAQWNAIKIGIFNDSLETVTVHYNSPVPTPIPEFADTPAWCAKEAQWAAEQGITKGYGGQTTFAPGRDCSQVEILTFLHRAADKPTAGAKAPFDVASYYQDAVNWAYEEGFIDDAFSPDAPCTRAQAVTYIWKALDEPEAKEAAGFSDVDAGAPIAQAVSWAVEKKVTKGYGAADTFAPNRVCTRGEIACFLYRAYN